MTVLIFILVLGVLIFVHELGHFLMAKRAGIRVDEFALGFPPRIASYRPAHGETEYILNLIPFGGYVKIYGENGEEENLESYDATRSMGSKSKLWQILVLAGGVLFNMLFAWFLFSLALAQGTNVAVDETTEPFASNIRLLVTQVSPDSPASNARIVPGDTIVSINGESTTDPQRFISLVRSDNDEVMLSIQKADGTSQDISVQAVEGIVPDAKAIGVGVEKVGTVSYSFLESIQKGWQYTWSTAYMMVDGLGDLLARSFKGDASLNELSGPVGIAKMSGEAASQGLPTLFSFAGLLSVNLAVLNIMPFPALDGGRILIVIAEAIRGKRFSLKKLQWINGVGFALLMLLMLVVTFGDIVKLF